MVRLLFSALLALLVFAGCGAQTMAPDAGLARYPLVPNGGGPVPADATLVSITFAGDARATDHDAFTRWLAESNWLLERAREYGVATVRAGAAVSLSGPLPAILTSPELRALLPLQPGAIYLVWLPDGVSVTDRYGNRTCLSNPGTGYHDATDGDDVPYVVVPACSARFSAVLDVLGSMHFDGARLAVDTLTNPTPRNAPAWVLGDAATGWTTLGTEVGDFCWGRFTQADGRTLQRVWSNAAAARGEEPCTPAPRGPAFGFTVSPSGRQPLRIAETVTLSVTGWSAAPMEDWRIEVTPWVGDFAIEASFDRTMLNHGQTATLTLRVPYPVPAGTTGGVLLRAMGTDDVPLWPVAFLLK